MVLFWSIRVFNILGIMIKLKFIFRKDKFLRKKYIGFCRVELVVVIRMMRILFMSVIR